MESEHSRIFRVELVTKNAVLGSSGTHFMHMRVTHYMHMRVKLVKSSVLSVLTMFHHQIHHWIWHHIQHHMWCFVRFGYQMYNLKNVQNIHGEVLILVKLQVSACNFAKINTPPWVFFTFFKLYKWYQIAQHTAYSKLLTISILLPF